ncbi:MAG: glucose-1-phosphate adenylyltransferase [Chloroflexi bacterium]|nr:MAG: glucose-1-phosphate adenylyltransferase [Chloroflexota bacterium]TME17793.1 MAG: glucose-1-phosphate adenylyltransferase [Chloroflexota bacterium]
MKVLAMVLAGGEGKRLAPLTADRAKPAVPFGGNYRLVDFVLSNLVNAGYLKIVVLTQYKSDSLDRHIAKAWRLTPMFGNYVATVPAQMRHGPRWFAGSADAIFQNQNLISDEDPDYICVFGADHVYRMDPRQMVDHHIRSGAGLTVAGVRAPRSLAGSLGVITPGRSDLIREFKEKPKQARGLPGAPDQVLGSMGNYVFTTSALLEALTEDAWDTKSKHDLGTNIVPMFVKKKAAAYYDFANNVVPGSTDRDRHYWRDVGELDAYYDATMDLIATEPLFNLYNAEWPIYSWAAPVPPAKFVFDEEGRRGQALNSMVSAGVIISGGTVRGSILSPEVRVESGALVEGSILMDGVHVGHGAVVRRSILDKGVVVADGAGLGVDLAVERERFTVTEKGITVVGKNDAVPPISHG